MRRFFSARILVGTLIGLSLGWLAAGRMSWGQSTLHPLVGTWNVTCTPDEMNSETREFKDTLTIKPDDTFVSANMKKKGFADGRVEEDTRRFGPTKWNVTIKSDKKESIYYQGTADGNEMQGTMVWTKANGDKFNYTFKGEPKR